MEKIKTEMDFFEGRVVLKDVNAFYCPACKEEFFDSKEGDSISEVISKMHVPEQFESRKKIAKVGNSFAIPISKEIADYMQIKKGEEVNIKVQSRKRLLLSVA